MKKFLFLFTLFVPFLLPGQDNQQFLIRAGKLFDSESGQFKKRVSILVKYNIIQEVREDREPSVEEKKNYTLIDLRAYTVLPGLIDAHTHLLYREEIHPGNNLPGLDLDKVLTMDGDAYRAIYGAARAKAYLEAGITAVQDLGNSGQFADVALKRAINEGLVPGPRMRCSGPGLSTEGGQLPGLIYKHREIVNDEYRIVKGPEDAVQAVRENINQGADVIKIYSNNTPNNTRLSTEEIRAIVKEAHLYGLRVTAHATDNKAVYNAVISGVDGIEHGYQVDDSTLELMAKKGVILVPTDGDSVSLLQYLKLSSMSKKEIADQLAWDRKFLGDRLQRAVKKGVMIAAGSDDYVDFKLPFAEPSIRTLIGYVESGIPIPRVLQFATINGSSQLNWSNKIGKIKRGYLADIIAVDDDLEKNIQAILSVRFVMKDGKIFLNKL